VALEQDLVHGMCVIVRLLALTTVHVLPAITSELGKSWWFPESADYSTFVLHGEYLRLPHFETQEL